ncbi:uncharacterized protein A4U43_C01F19260 [Asparagus officinalis]|uniref:Uncharacterized protein n=1 Tax=Asparagus officinalis TaxID=4686 RepID=A0A5P1FQK3_ASPOF|nr:uncharacterized protein A4U43_C01F19260 [Asparagus officinalis]
MAAFTFVLNSMEHQGTLNFLGADSLMNKTRDISVGDELQVKVNKHSSTKTQLPYDYCFLDFYKPSKIMNGGENLEKSFMLIALRTPSIRTVCKGCSSSFFFRFCFDTD